ncbi:unnamed protein product [Prorocentrum cordatum]|uniref:Uncharacterized protein n=1 Tax=Prorocentrum cordatum TaxID=2364126 RepID=A0ABN9UGL3_9DINO|nr:unnamed protein product [Polarella glacialis]
MGVGPGPQIRGTAFERLHFIPLALLHALWNNRLPHSRAQRCEQRSRRSRSAFFSLVLRRLAAAVPWSLEGDTEQFATATYRGQNLFDVLYGDAEGARTAIQKSWLPAPEKLRDCTHMSELGLGVQLQEER